MLKLTNAAAAKIIREVSEYGVEADWQSGIDKILAHCDASQADTFNLDSLFLAQVSGLQLDVCNMITNAIMMS